MNRDLGNSSAGTPQLVREDEGARSRRVKASPLKSTSASRQTAGDVVERREGSGAPGTAGEEGGRNVVGATQVTDKALPRVAAVRKDTPALTLTALRTRFGPSTGHRH